MGQADGLEAGLAAAGFDLDARALAILRTHFELLLRWNSKINLTSVRDPAEIIERHFVESLWLTRVLRLGPGTLYDVGSGAGFPGLPVKAAVPDLQVVLVESASKKAAFLKEVIRTARIEGIRVETTRVEDLAKRDGLEKANWVTLRAVRPNELLPVFRQMLVPNGEAVLFLGEDDANGIRSSTNGFMWKQPYRIPGSERRVILVGTYQSTGNPQSEIRKPQ